MDTIKRIAITPGEPAGIGPDVTIQIAQQSWPAELVVIADPDLLQQRAKQIGLPLELINFDADQPRQTHQPGRLKILPIKMATAAIAGKLNSANAAYVIATLTQAAELCNAQLADAIVTGPVNKEIINSANIPFVGHTEFFAQFCQVPQTVMLFVVDQLKVALITTHLALADVPRAITREKIQRTLKILHKGLREQFGMTKPNIFVAGLNPHAGEGGHFGHEEIDIIIPALDELREDGFQLTGPLPADTMFLPKNFTQADAFVAMYHDQALTVVKHLGFDRAVNVTLGLPFVRTSVDHGTALDIAGTGHANAGSLHAAILLAIKLSAAPQNSHR